MPLIGSPNLGLQVGQRSSHPLNIFFVIITPNFPALVCMAHRVPVHRHVHRLISGQQNERVHAPAI